MRRAAMNRAHCLKRVFDGGMRIVAFIACPYIVEKNLAHLDAKTSDYDPRGGLHTPIYRLTANRRGLLTADAGPDQMRMPTASDRSDGLYCLYARCGLDADQNGAQRRRITST